MDNTQKIKRDELNKEQAMEKIGLLLMKKKKEICTLTLNRPKVMNALNVELIRVLQEAFERIKSDETIRVVILEGAGGNFSSGGDMGLFSEDRDPPRCLEDMQYLGRLILTMRKLPKPIITKVTGVAVGGGANLALAGDFVLSSHNARFSQIFVNIGLILDSGGTYFLPRLVGLAKARELALLGEMIDGKTAASMGLIYKSFPEENLDGEVNSLVRTLLQKPMIAMALIKEGLETSLNMSLKEVLKWEASHQAIMFHTREHKKAVREFFKSRRRVQKI